MRGLHEIKGWCVLGLFFTCDELSYTVMYNYIHDNFSTPLTNCLESCDSVRMGGCTESRGGGGRGSMMSSLGLDKLCFYFNLLCFSVMLVTCAYYAFKVNLLCSIMLKKLINNDGKYSKKL